MPAFVLAALVLVHHVDPVYAEPGQNLISAEASAAAEFSGLDPAEVQGAANTEGVDPWTYVAWHTRPPIHRVRLTYYALDGVTYGCTLGRGALCGTRPGGTACSWNYSLGTRFRFPNGETFVCNDRGQLGSDGWLDLWRRADLAHRYGPYVTVEVLGR